MSYESCAEFAGKIGSDEQLQQQVGNATAEFSTIKERAAAVAKVGANFGYDFSAEEALSAFVALRQSEEDDVELSEEELGLVAGGVNYDRRLQQLLFRPTSGDVTTGVGHYANYMKFILGG